jgi:hypothetical protein
MSHKLTITLRDWIFNTYLSEPTNNLSAKIEDLIVKGAESIINGDNTNKSRMIILSQQNLELINENKKLNLELGKYKEHYKNYDPELEAKEAIARGAINAGINRDEF